MHKRSFTLMTGILSISVLLTGCFQGEQSMKKIDPPQTSQGDTDADNKAENTEHKAKTNSENKNMDDEQTNAVVDRQLYLIDANGMVAPQTIEIPQSESKAVASTALEYLVKDGPVANLLPNGFQAVLPAGTEIKGMDLKKDGTMIIDFSNEFKDYKPENELNILQAITYTMTQFDNVNKVKLWINGKPLNEMPVNGTPIGQGYSRENGINLVNTDTIDLIDSKAVTMYYPAEFNENEYYVPVTQYIRTDGDNYYKSVIKTLIEGPGPGVNAKLVFNENTALASEPTIQDGVLKLNFNKAILKDEKGTVIADKVMETIVRTLTTDKDVKAVQVNVENAEKVFNEEGEAYNKPVTKEMLTPTKKL